MPDEDETTFIDFEGLGVLSRAAFEMHSFGILNSVRDGSPGFVSDEYLNAISAETTTTTLELEAAGLWERRDGGYFVVADDMLRMHLSRAMNILVAASRPRRLSPNCQPA